MKPRTIVITAAGAGAAALGVWMAIFPSAWQNWLGFSRAAYFQNGTNYAFFSGIGPFLLTALGMSTIIGTLWHAVNCHEDGCLKIGRHKINGTPWCNDHHEKARHHRTIEEILETLAESAERTNILLKDVAATMQSVENTMQSVENTMQSVERKMIDWREERET
jgi:hypothetical protein